MSGRNFYEDKINKFMLVIKFAIYKNNAEGNIRC